MTLGGVNVSAWLAWLLAAAAVTGVWFWLAGLATGLVWARDQLRAWRIFRDDDQDDYTDGAGDYAVPLEELPPERSREELGFTGPQPATGMSGSEAARQWWLAHPEEARKQGLPPDGSLLAVRERRAPWYEAEYRHHYAAMDLDYPSGLLSRIREYPVN